MQLACSMQCMVISDQNVLFVLIDVVSVACSSMATICGLVSLIISVKWRQMHCYAVSLICCITDLLYQKN